MSIEYYNINAEKFYKDTHKLEMQEIYNKFLPYIPKNGKILDAGCGSGRDIKAFSKLGYQVTAFDASLEMVKKAKILSNRDVLHMDFKDVFWKSEFDGIWACASLLHVPEKNFYSVVSKLYNSLIKGRPFYLSFKYGYREYIKDGRFFQCHDENSLKNSMNEIGLFSKEESWITKDIRPNREEEIWLNMIFVKY